MNETVHNMNIREFMTRHLVEVFETMLSMKAIPIDPFEPPHYDSRVSGSVGFAGDDINGAVYLHLSASFATRIAATMLGLAPEQIEGETDVNDVVGEVSNMLAGGLKSAFCDTGYPCAVSTPAIIRGTSFIVEPIPEVEQIRLLFGCENERIFVEVHLKSN
jgi:chemotaxis protein CheX